MKKFIKQYPMVIFAGVLCLLALVTEIGACLMLYKSTGNYAVFLAPFVMFALGVKAARSIINLYKGHL